MLRKLVEIVGDKSYVAVLKELGGRHIYIPEPDCPSIARTQNKVREALVEIVGIPVYAELVAEIGGHYMYIPKKRVWR